MDEDEHDEYDQWIFSEEELKNTPSILEGMSVDKERENRSKGCNLILLAGVNLGLPQITISTASIFLHRFYMRESMNKYHYYNVAGTALFLATKVEENCRKIKDLIVEVARVAQKNPTLIIDEQSKEYWKWNDTIMLTEQIMLELLCFDVNIEQPYEYLKNFVNTVIKEKEPRRKEIMGSAWAFLNDSLLTVLNLTFSSKVIAGGALYFALKFFDVTLPQEDGKEWYEILGLDLKEARSAFHIMADLWETNPLRKPDKLYLITPEPEERQSSLTPPRTIEMPIIEAEEDDHLTTNNNNNNNTTTNNNNHVNNFDGVDDKEEGEYDDREEGEL